MQAYIEKVYATNQARPKSKPGTSHSAAFNSRENWHLNKELEALYPRNRLEIIDENPLYAVLYAEGRRGQARCVFRGKIPADLKLLVSEQYQDPSPDNATWQFTRPRVAVFRPRE